MKQLILKLLSKFPFVNRIKLRSCDISGIKSTIMLKSVIDSKGKNNKIFFGGNCFFKNSTIHIRGDNNTIIINNDCRLNNTELWIEDDNNKIEIGRQTSICGKTHIACIEGTEVLIGEDCLFSSEIVIRTGDSHSIVDLDGNRVNYSKNVIIGNHVWVCHKVLICKGVSIGANCVVATGSIVTKQFLQPNTILAGVPAEQKKQNINWEKKRI